MKKKLLIIIICLVLLILLGVGLYFGLCDKKNNNVVNTFDNTIVSTLTIDVNPSMEIGLNIDNTIVSVKALNIDSEEMLKSAVFEGKTLVEGVNTLVELLKENNYLDNENNIVLVNVSNGELKELVETTINKVTSEKEVKTELIVLNVEETEELKSLAEENNITIAKAYYIEEQIKENEDLNFSDYVDSNVSEIKSKVEEEVKRIEETKKEEEKKQSSSGSSSSGSSSSQSSSYTGYTNQPSDPTKDLDAWCKYNKNGNPYGHEKPLIQENSSRIYNETKAVFESKYQVGDHYLASGQTSKEDSRSSYCVADVITFVTEYAHVVYITDSVTGAIIEEIVKTAPTVNITQDQARDIAYQYFVDNYGIDLDNLWTERSGTWLSASEDYSSGSYTAHYDIGVLMRDESFQGGCWVDAASGSISHVWGNR